MEYCRNEVFGLTKSFFIKPKWNQKEQGQVGSTTTSFCFRKACTIDSLSDDASSCSNLTLAKPDGDFDYESTCYFSNNFRLLKKSHSAFKYSNPNGRTLCWFFTYHLYSVVHSATLRLLFKLQFKAEHVSKELFAHLWMIFLIFK